MNQPLPWKKEDGIVENDVATVLANDRAITVIDTRDSEFDFFGRSRRPFAWLGTALESSDGYRKNGSVFCPTAF